MTENERTRRNECYADYKLAYAALMLCYPFGVENLDGEEWRDIAGYEGRYQISNYGRVKSFHWGKIKILKPSLHNCGYLYIELNEKGKCKKCKIHRLVAEAFIPNPQNLPTVDHIFNNKFDNFFENLRWTTQSENNQYAYDTGAKKSGEQSYQSKLSNEQVREIRKIYKKHNSEFGMNALGEKFGVSPELIWRVANYKTYKNVE